MVSQMPPSSTGQSSAPAPPSSAGLSSAPAPASSAGLSSPPAPASGRSATPPPSLAVRKRQLVSDELREIALQLLAARGYDATTVDEIATAAGMSRRTFHRYYASKEDVVIQLLADVGDQVRTELSARPATEPPAVALRRAVGVAIDFCSGHHDPVKMLAVVRLILGTPSLHARFLSLQAEAQAGLTEVLAARLGLPPDDLFPEMAVRMALTAFDAVLERWAASNGELDPQEMTDQAFALLEPALRG